MATETYEIVEVICEGCGKDLLPADTDWELFRIGVTIHNNPLCYAIYTEFHADCGD